MRAVRRLPTVASVGLCSVLVVMAAAFTAAPARAADEVDPWGRDRDSVSGTIDEVCGPGPTHDASSQRPGRLALMEWLDETFPEIVGFSGFVCREIHNPRSSCAGRLRPTHSSCWSTHAAGRAIDVGVGGGGDQDGTPVGKELGDRLANLLLARVDGIDNYRARIMGVQQLLWDGRCWSTRDHAGAGITDINDLDDDCVNLHDNHVHITLSEAGADGLTSFHTGDVAASRAAVDAAAAIEVIDEPVGDPRDAHLLAYDAQDGRLLLRRLSDDGSFEDGEATEDFEAGWTSLATPDVAGNGDDEVFAYDKSDGRHVVREIRSDGTLGSVVGGGDTLEPGWTLVATPDVDGDGDDEVFLYRGDNGRWALHELDAGGGLGPPLQADKARIDVYFSHAATPDLDGDGDDELLLYRQFDGRDVVLDFDDLDAIQAGDDAADTSGDQAQGESPDEGPDDGEEASAPGVDLDTDGDGAIDVTIGLDAVEPQVVDPDGLPIAPEVLTEHAATVDGDDESAVDGSDAVDEPSGGLVGAGLGTPLLAGYTALSAVDVDADGIDELALYREQDGCLAIRELHPPVRVVDLDAAADADDAAEAQAEPVVTEFAEPCLGAAPAEDGDGDADSAEEAVVRELDPDTWLVESREGLEPGWTFLAGTAVD